MMWQPIETAPKGEEGEDGPLIMLLDASCHPDDYDTSIAIGFWSKIDAWGWAPRNGWCDWCAGIKDDIWVEVVNPTHWMPLPQPPITETPVGT